MRDRNSPLSPEVWLADMFATKAVQIGEVSHLRGLLREKSDPRNIPLARLGKLTT